VRRRAAFVPVGLAAVVTLGLGLAGCGVRSDPSPRSLAADDVPYGLMEEAPVTAPPPTTPTVSQVNVAVYFLSGDRLQPAPRSVPNPATPGRAINALLGGPTDDEAVAGLRTAVHPSTEVDVGRPSDAVVPVDLSAAFAAVQSQEQRLALAQIVFTATGFPGVTGVRFTLADAPVEIPLPDGTLTSEPVGRAAFPALAPPVPADTPQPA